MESGHHKSPEENRKTIDALYRISGLASRMENPKDALEAVLGEVVSLLGASSASVCLIHPETRLLEVEVSSGLTPDQRQLALPVGIGVTGWVALHGRPLLVNDTWKDSRYIEVRPGIRSELAVPMEDGGRVLGVVNVDSDRPNAFREEDLKLLVLVTREATRSLNQIWVVNQLRQTARQFEQLALIARTIVSKKDISDILDLITRSVENFLPGGEAAFFILGADGNSLELHSLSPGITMPDFAEKISLSDSSVGTAVRHAKQVEVLDLPRTEEHHIVPLVQKFGLRSMLATPLSFEDRPIGVLCIYTRTLHRFNNDERRLFTALASLGAVAIENSRLYDRVFVTEETLRRNDKLTTLGLLSAEIAHEIRNPLTVLQLLFAGLNPDFAEDDERRMDVAVIAEKIHQLEEIVTRVLSFGKSGQTYQARWNLADLIDDTLRLVRLKLVQMKIRVEFVIKDDRQNFFVYCQKGQIQQAILNLLINATDAMPGGGEILVELHRLDNQRVQVDFRDSGCGVVPELQASIFDSFLSGREGGTGLGLAIVRRIVESHRGEIELLSSKPGETVFSFRLPVDRSGA